MGELKELVRLLEAFESQYKTAMEYSETAFSVEEMQKHETEAEVFSHCADEVRKSIASLVKK